MPTRIAITGAAGLVGQNLIARLKRRGVTDILAIDKHPANTAILRQLHPDIRIIEANLAKEDHWQEAVAECDVFVICHAQISGLDPVAFEENNVTATNRLIDIVKLNSKAYIVHISSSAVESAASNWYSATKAAQERIVLEAGVPSVILRPTLMFGWFDRKHIGWLTRFIRRVPIFPIPGHGRYLRQPLYAGDFCEIIISCIAHRPNGAVYNISGHEKIHYIDLMRAVRDICKVRTTIVRIPYRLFWALLWAYGLIDRDPPFTTKQLEALATPDIFEVIDWPAIFGVKATPLRAALEESYCDPVYSRITLEF